MADLKWEADFRKINTIKIDIIKENHPDGSIILKSAIQLGPHPYRLTERFKKWAFEIPNKVFLGRRNKNNEWITLTYREAYEKVLRIAWHLLQSNVATTRPLLILSENSIEHALLALAAMHIGIPYSPVSPAYSLRSTDFSRLDHITRLLTPGLLFVQDGKKYEAALTSVAGNVPCLVVSNPPDGVNSVLWDSFLQRELKPSELETVEKAFQAIQPETIAKVLFTSGSTGVAKGVINTHENISTNWQQITQTFPFLMEEGLELIDWLPWNHTYGGNHNFGIALYNGGFFYIDDGNPTESGLSVTVANLKDIKPTVYFNVPRGFEALLPYFKNDVQLREHFFSKLKMLFYAGATLPQHLWDAWESLAVETTGEKVMMGTGLGCTESCPSALFVSEPGGFAGLVGVPVPGLEVKLVPSGERWEARYQGRNIFPGYWRQPEMTKLAFDEEGFYCTGDALKLLDETDPNRGLVFDGRITEDFKLDTGTWVNTGIIRAQMIAAGRGLIQDVVITGHDKGFVGAIVFVAQEYCRKITGGYAPLEEMRNHPIIQDMLQSVLTELASVSTGSSLLVRRAYIAEFTPAAERGEITDKGSINQRAVIQNHHQIIERIYAPLAGDEIFEITVPVK